MIKLEQIDPTVYPVWDQTAAAKTDLMSPLALFFLWD